MNVAQLKDRIFRGTQHKYTDQFHMLDLLNEALNSMTNDAKLEDSTTLYLSSGIANYPLPSNYKSPRALVEGTIDNPTLVYDLISLDDLTYGYSIWNNDIIIKPTPSEEKELNFYYYKWATELENDEDVPDIDEHYHNALASYAIAMILPLIDGPQWLVDQHFRQWENANANFRLDIAKKNKQATVRKVQTWR